jgi:hypothetical protein
MSQDYRQGINTPDEARDAAYLLYDRFRHAPKHDVEGASIRVVVYAADDITALMMVCYQLYQFLRRADEPTEP